MMKVIGIIVGIVGFLLLITIHEGGHFIAAKLVGVRVNEFSVGMGPVIYQKQKNDTLYSFRAFPVGGYCALAGEDEESDDPYAFTNASFFKKFVVLVAGSFNNLLAGFIIFICVYSIVANGQVGFGRVLEVSCLDFWDVATSIFQFIGGLFKGTSSVNDLSGVVGIVSVVSQTAEVGLLNVVYLIGILSVNLGVVNLLPIPALDGGRILLSFINVLCGKKISEKAEGIINAIGLMLLLALMVYLVFKDSIALIRG